MTDDAQITALENALDAAISVDIGGRAPGEAAYYVLRKLHEAGYAITPLDDEACNRFEPTS